MNVMGAAILLWLDLLGTAIFALTGAVKGVRCRLDLFGVAVLACCVGTGGSMIRDCIIGALPVAALQDERYLLICIAVGLLVFWSARYWMKYGGIIQIGDALGLGVFTAIVAAKGEAYGLNPVGVILCGVLTAIGGGVIRDVFSGEVPTVLKSDFYATASLVGAGLYWCLSRLQFPPFFAFLVVAAFVAALRCFAIHYHLQLPARRKKTGRTGH